MALADPQSVTISTVAKTLPRVSSGNNQGVFAKDDLEVQMAVAHQYGKRLRRTVAFTHRKTAPDPLFPANNAPYSMTFRLVFDVPPTGYTVAEQKAVVDGCLASLQASSGLNITKILGGES